MGNLIAVVVILSAVFVLTHIVGVIFKGVRE